MFHRGDWSGFWALLCWNRLTTFGVLLADNLTNMVILSGILIGAFHFPDALVYGRILPALGVALIFGLSVYVYFAYRLKKKERRDDVTALPYGISTPVMSVKAFLRKNWGSII